MSIQHQTTSGVNDFVYLSSTFETPSPSIFKRRELCYLTLDDKGVNLYKKQGDKKPKKSFIFDEVEISVEKKSEPEGFSFVISDQKKNEVLIFAKTEEEMAKFAEGIVNNKLSYDVTKRKKSLMKVTEEGKRFNKIWDNDSEEEEDVPKGSDVIKGKVDTKKSLTVENLPEENEGWLFKQGGMIKNWKKRFFVLDCFQIKYYPSDQIENVKPKGTIVLDEQCSVKLMKQGKKSKKKGGFGFEIKTPNRTFQLMCGTQEELSTWVYKIRQTINLKAKMLKKSAELVGKKSSLNLHGLEVSDKEQPGDPTKNESDEMAADDIDGTLKILKTRIEEAKKMPLEPKSKIKHLFSEYDLV